MLRHVVMWKFKDTENPEEKAKNIAVFRDGLLALRGVVPEIKALQFGIQTADNAKNYDAVLILDVEDAAALNRYLNHPEHKKVSAFCETIRETRTAVDFEVE